MANYIIPQSAGSLSVAVLSLIMTILQILFFLRKPKYKWFVWSAAISFTSIVYAVGVFIEYNTRGFVNRIAGLLEFTAIVFLLYFLYEFTFAYFNKKLKYYRIIAVLLNFLILIILWFTDYIVADRFVARNFIGLKEPFVELAIGPAGLFFEIYIVLGCIIAIVIWLKQREPNPKHRTPFFIGIILWIALGIHDGLATMGLHTFQYLMEYGFFGFSIAVLWVVFESFVDISSEDKYRIITEYANDGLMIVQDERVIFANPACSALLPGLADNSPLNNVLDIVIPEDREKLIQYYNTLLDKTNTPYPLIIKINRFHEVFIVEVRESLMSYRNRPAVLVVVRDITEQKLREKALKESEEKVLQLRKMESLGLLAGGVAHDLNNVLSGIVSYPELLLMDLPQDSPMRKPLETVMEAGKKAAAIVEDLLTTARGVSISKEPLNINSVVIKCFKTIECQKLIQYHPSVTIENNLSTDLLNINGSSDYIGKVIMNLMSNACEAIKGEGNVTVTTMNRYLDRPLKGYEDISIGEYAVLSIKDNGPGISQADLKRIFDPFYIKKVMGRSGTGLGLMVVWNVVQDHNGYIDVKSGDEGTTFDLYFPVTRDPVIPRDLMFRAENLYGNGEMILIIDDVKSQRDILSVMLKTLNYNTKAVTGGEEALKYLKEYYADLLILDMIMDPGINGRVTYERIKEIHPDQKAIIISGFAETEDVKETLKMGAGRYLKKPVILKELGLAVKVELEK